MLSAFIYSVSLITFAYYIPLFWYTISSIPLFLAATIPTSRARCQLRSSVQISPTDKVSDANIFAWGERFEKIFLCFLMFLLHRVELSWRRKKCLEMGAHASSLQWKTSLNYRLLHSVNCCMVLNMPACYFHYSLLCTQYYAILCDLLFLLIILIFIFSIAWPKEIYSCDQWLYLFIIHMPVISFIVEDRELIFIFVLFNAFLLTFLRIPVPFSLSFLCCTTIWILYERHFLSRNLRNKKSRCKLTWIFSALYKKIRIAALCTQYSLIFSRQFG